MKLSKYFFVSVVCATVIFSSCKSNKVEPTPPDVFETDDESEDGSEGISSVVNDTYEGVEDVYDEGDAAADNSSAKNKKIKKPFSWKAIFGGKFAEGDSCVVNTSKVLGGIKEQSAVIMLNMKNGYAGWGSSYMAAYYVFELDESGREKLKKACEQYLSDFGNKKLNPNIKQNKTKKLYGKVNARVDWGTIKASLPNKGAGSAYLGYKFVGKSPYFTISMPKVVNQSFVEGHSDVQESLELNYYFTKKQLQIIVDSLSEDKLKDAFRMREIELYGEAYVNAKETGESGADEYDEY